MRYEKRIIAAFESNNIKKILLIDDAYDPPELDDTTVAQLADFLNEAEGQDDMPRVWYRARYLLGSATTAADAGEARQ